MNASRTLPPGLLDMLVEEQILSASVAAGIRGRVQEAWVPIGKILRQRGHLTMAEMMHLLELQTAEPHLRLGELAVREHFCTEQDLEEALRLQREGSPHPLEIVLTEMPCDRDRLCKVLLRYVRQLETRTAEQRVGVHSA